MTKETEKMRFARAFFMVAKTYDNREFFAAMEFREMIYWLTTKTVLTPRDTHLPDYESNYVSFFEALKIFENATPEQLKKAISLYRPTIEFIYNPTEEMVQFYNMTWEI